jgi:hypothetical protein
MTEKLYKKSELAQITPSMIKEGQIHPGFIVLCVGPDGWAKGYTGREAWIRAGKPNSADFYIAWAAVQVLQLTSTLSYTIALEKGYAPKFTKSMNRLCRKVGKYVKKSKQ